LRIAVTSDIHGNWHAFEAVLADAEQEQVDEIWCLGDIVGYGPQPVRCVEEARARSAVCLLGNHDLAAIGQVDLAGFSPDAAESARWTIKQLDESALAFLASLEPKGERSGVQLFHASPRDPVWEYVLSESAVGSCSSATATSRSHSCSRTGTPSPAGSQKAEARSS
jgi:hypothetical protein